MDDKPTILRTDEEVTFSDTGKPVERMRVMWKLGEHGPFYTRFDKLTFNGVNAKMEIDRLANEVRALHR